MSFDAAESAVTSSCQLAESVAWAYFWRGRSLVQDGASRGCSRCQRSSIVPPTLNSLPPYTVAQKERIKIFKNLKRGNVEGFNLKCDTMINTTIFY